MLNSQRDRLGLWAILRVGISADDVIRCYRLPLMPSFAAPRIGPAGSRHAIPIESSAAAGQLSTVADSGPKGDVADANHKRDASP